MLMIFAQSISVGVLTVVVILVLVVIASYTVRNTQDPLGERSSAEPSSEAISSLRKPSIERSATNSTALITVQANPDRPVVYMQELVSGSKRLVRLTVLYEQSLDDSELAILQSVESVLKSEPVRFEDVEDPSWIDYVKHNYTEEANKQWT